MYLQLFSQWIRAGCVQPLDCADFWAVCVHPQAVCIFYHRHEQPCVLDICPGTCKFSLSLHQSLLPFLPLQRRVIHTKMETLANNISNYSQQFLKNCRSGTAASLSVLFLAEWMLGDALNLVGAILTQQVSQESVRPKSPIII